MLNRFGKRTLERRSCRSILRPRNKRRFAIYPSIYDDEVPRSRLGRLFRYTVFFGLFTGAGLTYWATGDEGRKRSLRFWINIFPKYLHYRWVEYNFRRLDEEAQQEEYKRLHIKYSPMIHDLTLEMRGFYLKNAQQMSIRDDFVPEPYLTWCKEMQDQAPVILEEGAARKIIEENLGRPIGECFAEFDDNPIGSASIGQVHQAKLHDGREVAVKVMHPGSEKLFRSDLKTLRYFCEIAMPQFVPGLDEIERQFLTEFDYKLEAGNLREARDAVMTDPYWAKRVMIPEPVMDLCGHEVLTMTYVPGVKLIEGVKKQMRKYAIRQGKTFDELESEFKRKLEEEGYMSLDANTNQNARYQRMQDLADYSRNWWRLTWNWTLGWVLPNFNVEWSPKIINLGEILTLALKVHGYEIFVKGKFNGDPHPGNLLLCPDGRLGLIDYGQFKILEDHKFREILSKLIISLARDDRPEIVRLLKASGHETRRNDPVLGYKLAAFWLDRDTDDITDGKNFQEFMDHVEKHDPIKKGKKFPEDVIMPARVSMLLRGLGLAFGIKFSVAKMWEPFAQEYLREQGIEY